VSEGSGFASIGSMLARILKNIIAVLKKDGVQKMASTVHSIKSKRNISNWKKSFCPSLSDSASEISTYGFFTKYSAVFKYLLAVYWEDSTSIGGISGGT